MIRFIAHKGNGNHHYAQNSKEAILTSLQNHNIAGVELDIRLTKDKKLVIIHDPVIDFVSNGTGIVKYMTVKELKKYNFGTKQNPSKITTLEELLKKIKTNKKILIEIKQLENNQEIIDILYSILQKYKNLNIIVISFNQELLKYMKQKDKQISCGILVGYFLNHQHDIFDYTLYESFYIDKAPYSNHPFFFTINQKKQVEQIEKRYPKAYIITDHADDFSVEFPPTE